MLLLEIKVSYEITHLFLSLFVKKFIANANYCKEKNGFYSCCTKLEDIFDFPFF